MDIQGTNRITNRIRKHYCFFRADQLGSPLSKKKKEAAQPRPASHGGVSDGVWQREMAVASDLPTSRYLCVALWGHQLRTRPRGLDSLVPWRMRRSLYTSPPLLPPVRSWCNSLIIRYSPPGRIKTQPPYPGSHDVLYLCIYSKLHLNFSSS